MKYKPKKAPLIEYNIGMIVDAIANTIFPLIINDAITILINIAGILINKFKIILDQNIDVVLTGADLIIQNDFPSKETLDAVVVTNETKKTFNNPIKIKKIF